MPSLASAVLASAAFSSLAYAQGVITSAKGDTGTSYAMQVEIANYADANYINQAEIEANAVNACGRTLLAGDISEAGITEELIESGNYTTVSKSGTITMTISQRYSNGTGPFTCDLDEASNALGAYGQTNLTVTQDSSQYGTGDLTLSITLPSDLTCIGGSTGNMCTVRCINSYDFGGCITVQQTDVTANVNTVSNIVTEEEATAIAAQVTQNQKDLAYAEQGLADASSTSDQALAIVKAILAGDVDINADAAAEAAESSTSTTACVVAAAAAATTTTSDTATAAAATTSGTGTATSKTKTRTRTKTHTKTKTSSTATDSTATAAAAAADAATSSSTKTKTKTTATAAAKLKARATPVLSPARERKARNLRWAVRRYLDESDE